MLTVSNPSIQWQTIHKRGVVRDVTRFFKFYPSHIFVIGEARHFKFRVLIDTEEYECMHDILLPKGMYLESHDLLNLGK